MTQQKTVNLMYHNNQFNVRYGGFRINDFSREENTLHIDVDDENYFNFNLKEYEAELSDEGIELTKGEEQILLYEEEYE